MGFFFCLEKQPWLRICIYIYIYVTVRGLSLEANCCFQTELASHKSVMRIKCKYIHTVGFSLNNNRATRRLRNIYICIYDCKWAIATESIQDLNVLHRMKLNVQEGKKTCLLLLLPENSATMNSSHNNFSFFFLLLSVEECDIWAARTANGRR